MNLDPQAIVDVLLSHALASGYFDRVAGHEPKAKPGNGLSYAAWMQFLGPVPEGSGLASTAGLLVMQGRLYSPFIAEPPDAIDPNLTVACSALLGAYSGDFTLGGQVRNIDLLGAHSEGLSASAGYLNQDGTLYRVYDITLPMVINDVWDQAS